MNTEIKGREALKIQAVAGVFDYAKGTKMEGKKYRRFAYQGKVFTANSEDPFCANFDNGHIYSVNLDSNEEGQLSLVGHTTIAQEVNMAKTEVILSAFTAENYIAGKLTNVEALEGAVV